MTTFTLDNVFIYKGEKFQHKKESLIFHEYVKIVLFFKSDLEYFWQCYISLYVSNMAQMKFISRGFLILYFWCKCIFSMHIETQLWSFMWMVFEQAFVRTETTLISLRQLWLKKINEKYKLISDCIVKALHKSVFV